MGLSGAAGDRPLHGLRKPPAQPVVLQKILCRTVRFAYITGNEISAGKYNPLQFTDNSIRFSQKRIQIVDGHRETVPGEHT